MGHGSVSIILAGDTHVGNNYGICTPNPELKDGRTYKYSVRQQKLYQNFQMMCDRIENKDRILAFITMGDLTDGPNIRKSGLDLWTTDPLEAIYDVSKLLLPLARKARVVRSVRGSPYHVSPDNTQIDYDELAATMIGAKGYQSKLSRPAEQIRLAAKSGKSMAELIEMAKPMPDHPIRKKLQKEDNIYRRDLLDGSKFDYPSSSIRYKAIYNGVALMAKHVGSYSPNPMYRGTGMTRNDVIMTLQADKHFPDGYDSIAHFYGHSHYYFVTGNATHYNINVPCWKLNDTFLLSKGITEPELGIMELIIEPNGRIILNPLIVGRKNYPVEPPEVLS